MNDDDEQHPTSGAESKRGRVRGASPILALKRFHNDHQQECLYNRYVQRGQRVLELGSGPGGALLKLFHRHPRQVVMVDISAQHIAQSKQRAEQMFGSGATLGRGVTKTASALKAAHAFHAGLQWFQGDLRLPETYRQLVVQGFTPRPGMFDVVSAQFALTYFWESRTILTGLMHWIATMLRPGGYFLVTVADGDLIVDLLCRTGGDNFHSDLADIQLLSNDRDSDGVFNRAVSFRLEGSELVRGDDGQGGVHEFLTHYPTLLEIAGETGFHAVWSQTFAEAYTQYVRDHPHAPALTRDERAVSFLNRTIVLQKT